MPMPMTTPRTIKPRTTPTRTMCSLLVLAAAAGTAIANPDADAPHSTRVQPASSLDIAGLLGLPPGPAFHGTTGRGADAVFVLTGDDPEGDAPSDVVFTPDGTRIVIAHRESRNLIVWDAATLNFLGAVSVSGAAQALAITPDSTTAVVANIDNDTVSIVDLTTLTETAVIPVGPNPGLVAINGAGDLAAVGVGLDSTLQVIDIASASIVRTVAGIGYGSRISFSPEALATSIQYSPFFFAGGDRLVNADIVADEVQIIDVRTGSVIRTPVADVPAGLALSGDGTRAVVSHSGSTRLLTVIDTATGSVVATIPAPENLSGPIAVNSDATRAAAAVQNATRVVDLAAGSFGPTLNTASINELLATFDGQYAVAVGFRGAVIDLQTGALVAQVNNAVSTEHGAVSPTAYLVAMCSTTFGDDLVVANVQGSSGSLLAYQRTGPETEGDRCRTVAVSPDGSRTVGVSIFSDNVAIVDTATGSVTGIAPVGERPSAVAISPDGTRAVVGNLDSSFASVIDLSTATSTSVNISRRAGAVAISPDSRYAYLGVLAAGDGVWRIDLDTNTVAGPKIATGNMGGVGYAFSQNSGIAISNGGTRLAVAGSFDNVVSIIDATAWSLLTNLPAGNFPTFVAFSADDSRLFASNRDDDTVSVWNNAGPVPVIEQVISVGDQPWQMVDDGQGRLWVNNWGDAIVGVYSLATGAPVGFVSFDNAPVGLAYDATTDTIRVAHGTLSVTLGGPGGFGQSQSGTLSVIDAATFARTDYDLGVGPSALAQSAGGTVVAVAAPIGDGLAILSLLPGCSAADLAPPFGTLNLFDVTAYIALYNDQTAAADLAAPFGVFNYFDIAAFLASFNAGCP